MTPYVRLLGYVLRYRRKFLLGLVCVVITTAIALASPMVLRYAIDDLTRGVTRAKLAFYGTLLLAIGVVGGLFRFLMRRILIGASRDIEYDMRNDFFAHLQKLPLSYFQEHRTGDLMSRATNDLNAVRMMIGPSIMYSANTVLTFVVGIALLLSIDTRLTLVALVPLPFVTICVRGFGAAIHRRFDTIQAQLADVSAIAQEALSGVRVVRAYRQEHAELDRFRIANAEYLARNRSLIALQGMFFPSMAFFLGLGALAVLWFGSREVILGRITVGQFVAFSAYLTMLSWPMIAFGWVTNMLQRGTASWKRMQEVMTTEPAIRDQLAISTRSPQGPARSGIGSVSPVSSGLTVHGAIEFRNLTFAYGTRVVLDGISATIEPGQTVALVGPTGAGKSTLISLLPRLHEPPRGTVFVDGIDVRDLPLAVLRGAIGFVPQEPFLFSDTLADNIAFGLDARNRADTQVAGRGAATRGADTQVGPYDEPVRADLRVRPERRHDRILEAAAVARLDKDVADFPRGYETIVGERGITLSGGQKQRTALARAITVDPKILVLDDALSAVDTYTEEEILSRLRVVMRQRTSIIVSHRISTVRDADLILVLDSGRIIERGTHDELVRHGGLYAALHRKQLLEDELAAS